ncbi:Actin family like protein [Aduncisulcus paluster]|uniref:Actin family like protein n=1 Tax=Aduncisulcus paluster TaxID=2918883 RepID=A0ABQ5K2W7_9EUKA|nr:Actin family like protein [Aduncisulcus paluster]
MEDAWYSGQSEETRRRRERIPPMLDEVEELKLLPYSSSGINWEDISSFYEHIISKLEVTPEHPFAISVPFLHADEFMKRSAEILFEKLRVPNVLFQPESVMSLASIGATTGLVVIMGYRSTSICPVFESYEMSHASRNISIGGHNVSNSLRSLMKEEDPTFSPSSVELELIKTMLGVCAPSRSTPHEAKPPSIEYELPDGKVIRLNDSRWKCVENSRLFIGRKEYKTIPECILGSILSLDIPYQKELTSCICLCGGSSIFPGLDDRIHGDLSLISDHLPTRPKVIAKPERDIASYMGISIYASVTHCFSKMAVCREVYQGCWAVECMLGYYLDKSSGKCIKACDIGYEANQDGECSLISSSSLSYPNTDIFAGVNVKSTSVSNLSRCLVCENDPYRMAVLEIGELYVKCICRSVFEGSDCSNLTPIIDSSPKSNIWIYILSGAIVVILIIIGCLFCKYRKKGIVSRLYLHDGIRDSLPTLPIKPPVEEKAILV